MKSLSVAIPWNFSRYIPRNGFHPLYQALFEQNEHLEFQVLDEVRFAEALRTDDALAVRVLRAPEIYLEKARDSRSEDKVRRAFINHVTPEELWLTSQIPGDIELHHTSPLTLGGRPFVLHCESFLPIFMPFAYQGAGKIKDVEGLRRFFGSLLGSEMCLGIFSHIPETLQHISRFFRDKEIDAKLHPSRIGLSDRVMETLQGHAKRFDIDHPVFLYSNSANQTTFGLRGGYIALRFAQRYLEEGRNGQFIFRANRPADAEMASNGIDVSRMHKVEGDRVHWLPGYLPEREMLRLFATADVLLLPSLNLHSVTIMQAMAAGTVPVVTDTIGPEHFVSDGDTGIVLNGVRQCVWAEDPETGIPYDYHLKDAAFADTLTNQMHERIVSLLSQPEEFFAMQRRARLHAKEKFIGSAFRNEFTTSLLTLWTKFRGAQRAARNEPILEGLSDHFHSLTDSGCKNFFDSPPVPTLLIDTGTSRVFRCKGVYWLARKLGADLDNWSPIALKRSGRLGLKGIQLAHSIQEFNDGLIAQPSDLGARALLKTDRFARRVGSLLRDFPIIYRLARSGYEELSRLSGLFQNRVERHIRASSQHADFGPWLLVQADPPGWHSQSPPVFPEHIQIDLRGRKIFDEIWLLPQEGQPRRAPKEVRIETSRNGRTWSVAMEVENFFRFNPYGWSFTSITPPASTSYLRISIYSNNGDDGFVTLTGIRLVLSTSNHLVWPPETVIGPDSLAAWQAETSALRNLTEVRATA